MSLFIISQFYCLTTIGIYFLKKASIIEEDIIVLTEKIIKSGRKASGCEIYK
jgi:hypothetical protein